MFQRWKPRDGVIVEASIATGDQAVSTAIGLVRATKGDAIVACRNDRLADGVGSGGTSVRPISPEERLLSTFHSGAYHTAATVVACVVQGDLWQKWFILDSGRPLKAEDEAQASSSEPENENEDEARGPSPAPDDEPKNEPALAGMP